MLIEFGGDGISADLIDGVFLDTNDAGEPVVILKASNAATNEDYTLEAVVTAADNGGPDKAMAVAEALRDRVILDVNDALAADRE